MALDLAHDDRGEGTPVLILHGLFGARGNWSPIAKRLAQDARIVTADLRNHGNSPWADTMAYSAMAADLERLLDTLGLDQAAVVGHSMGGKAAMALALTNPTRVSRLLVVDMAPVAYGTRLGTYVEAMKKLPVGELARRQDADRLLADEVPEAAIRQFLLTNLENDPGGGMRWRINLDVLGREMATIAGIEELPGAEPFEGKAAFLRGGRSDYVRNSHLPVIRRYFPAAELDTIEQAGHWVHAERPEDFIRYTRDFLDLS